MRTWKVVEAREQGVAWEDVFEHIAKTLDGAGSPKTIEGSYCRVVDNLRNDPDFYRRIGSISPQVAKAAVGLPRLEK